MPPATSGPLRGIRVLDFTHILSGPYCTMILGDLGADVIKVERISGDETRSSAMRMNDFSVQFGIVNRNKRSLALDLSSDAGVAVARRLAAEVDVVVENFRPGAMDKLGLGATDLRALNPRIVYSRISGFGTQGKGRDRGGFDIVAQGESGVLSVTGARDGELAKVGVPLADLSAGIYSALSICAALFSRETTGRGDVVDVALLDSVMSLLVWEAAENWTRGTIPRPMGTAHRNRAPYQTFEASDIPFVVGAGNQATWESLCVSIERPDLNEDSRFNTNASRMLHEAELVAILGDIFSTRPAEEWVDLLTKHGCPVGRVLNVAEAFDAPVAREADMKLTMRNPNGGELPSIGFPYKFEANKPDVFRGPPQLGGDTDAILAELLGMSEADIGELRAGRVIA